MVLEGTRLVEDVGEGTVEETSASDVKETNLPFRIDATELKSLIHVHGKGNNPSNLFVLKEGFLYRFEEERREKVHCISYPSL